MTTKTTKQRVDEIMESEWFAKSQPRGETIRALVNPELHESRSLYRFPYDYPYSPDEAKLLAQRIVAEHNERVKK